ncbi:MAG TPA: class I SAM-dependent methyltransferase [Solirubrobacteraceae bacterium]
MDVDLSNRVGEAAERFVPGERRGELIEAEHLARYWWASQMVAGRRLLDAGCGVGYGTAMLARAGAAEAIGLDLSPDSVAAAGKAHPELTFVTGDVHALPFEDDRFEVVTCFEVIEHVDRQQEVIAELARVLRPDGVLAISSPNRGVYPSGNPHHVHEYTPEELRAELAMAFAHVELRRQHDWVASAVLDDGQVSDAELGSLDADVGKVVGYEPGSETYTLAIASQQPLRAMPGRVVLGSVDEVRDGLLQGARAKTALADVAHLQEVEAQLRHEKRVLLAELEEVRATLRTIHRSWLWRVAKAVRGLGRLPR